MTIPNNLGTRDWYVHFDGTPCSYFLLIGICEYITTPKQKYLMGRIIGIFE